MSQKQVLEEEEYVEALETIIERDFFPDLAALKSQNATESKEDIRLFQTRCRQDLPSDGKRKTPPTTSSQLRGEDSSRRKCGGDRLVFASSSSWDQLTPQRILHHEEPKQRDLEESHGTVDQLHEGDNVQDVGPSAMSLDQFVATHTSEDNDSFRVLQEKAVEEHQRRYHWAFDAPAGSGRNPHDDKLLLLEDGTRLTNDQRAILDEVTAAKTYALDNRPAEPDTWVFRTRNPLLFPPEIETTRAICRVGNSSLLCSMGPHWKNQRLICGDDVSLQVDKNAQSQLLLENGTSTSLNQRTGQKVKGKKTTVYANSRFAAAEQGSEDDRKLAMKDAESFANENNELVEMTPVIAPGVDATPIMTWGEIESTPMILDAQTSADRVLRGPSFEVKDSSEREKLADRLETRIRQDKSRAKRKRQTPLRTLGGSRSTSSKRIAILETLATPQSRRLSSNPRSSSRTPVVGSDFSELRASYSSTPVRRVPLSTTISSSSSSLSVHHRPSSQPSCVGLGSSKPPRYSHTSSSRHTAYKASHLQK